MHHGALRFLGVLLGVLDRTNEHRPGRGWVALAFATGLAAGPFACIELADPQATENTAPHAALRAPVIAPVAAPVMLDAGDSLDLDGDPLTYRFDFIGFSSLDAHLEPAVSDAPRVQVVFPAPGLYTVQLTVTDFRGSEGSALQDVTARSDYPDPPDFCRAALDCPVGDECDAGVCYANGGAVEP